MELPVDIETHAFSLQSFQRRCILTQIGEQKISFPSQWVAEIMLIERSQILNIPFYDSRLLGMVHHQGNIIPLVTLQLANPVSQERLIQRQRIQDKLTAIRLSSSVSELSGVGLIVDQVIGSISQEQLLLNQQPTTESSNDSIEMFQPERIPQVIWQPR
ncbi:MAG TPA: chemotaxis protein CheW [Stenomitos sp.]